MNFFTDEKFRDKTAHLDYAAYWKQNLNRFPASYLRICAGMLPSHFFESIDDPIWLHDSKIQSVNQSDDTLHFVIHGDNHGELRTTELKYACIGIQQSIPEHLLENTSDCDLMCHELTINSDETFNHAILFASGDQLSINFSSLIIKSNA